MKADLCIGKDCEAFQVLPQILHFLPQHSQPIHVHVHVLSSDLALRRGGELSLTYNPCDGLLHFDQLFSVEQMLPLNTLVSIPSPSPVSTVLLYLHLCPSFVTFNRA